MAQEMLQIPKSTIKEILDDVKTARRNNLDLRIEIDRMRREAS